MVVRTSIKSNGKLRLAAVCLAFTTAIAACNLPFLGESPAAAAVATIVWNTNTPAPLPPSPTPTPENTPTFVPPTPTTVPPTATAEPDTVDNSPYLYYAQSGDTLAALAVRFSVLPSEVTSPEPLPDTTMINPGQLLLIPRRVYNTSNPQHLIPDSEVVFSPTALDFDIQAFVKAAGGDLSNYREYLGSTGWSSGAEVVYRVALENSINPRLLLSLLEYQSGMVYGTLRTDPDYMMGYENERSKGLFHQLVWVVNQLSIGYYGWREGRLTNIVFTDMVTSRLAPDLNAGTAAVHYYFSRQYSSSDWALVTDLASGWPALHAQMFSSPWYRAAQFEPIFPRTLVQPEMVLPFVKEQLWSFTGGPHGAWEREGSYAAIDFAPGTSEPGCVESEHWVVASAPGLVVRSGRGVIVIDLDGDGYEQTGWALLYLHLSTDQRIPEGTWVTTGDPLGHPSCEGGYATGTHIHIARKYNGEWIAADGPLPFVLSGWEAHAGSKAYEGTLTKGDLTIPANEYGAGESHIKRDK